MSEENNIMLTGAFSTPFLTYEVDSKIANEVEELFLKKESILTNMDHCYGDFYKEKAIDLENEAQSLLSNIIHCKQAFYDATGIETAGYIQSWTQDYSEEGHKHPKHNHGINGISGVYWIRANHLASELVFYNPNRLIDYVGCTKRTPFNAPSFPIKPKKGLMVIFPSYIDHEVLPTPEGTIRTTLAFNFPTIPVHIPD